MHARPALVTDVEVVDDYPASVLTHARRQHRWARGDWQILFWLFPLVPTRQGLERNTLPLISRWKIFDNLRRTLVAPGYAARPRRRVAGAARAGPGSGRPPSWAASRSRSIRHLLRLLVGPDPQQPLRVFLRIVREDVQTAAAQVLLYLTFLAYHAYEMVHAIALTLMRLLFTQRRLLEWETAAAAAARAAGLSARSDILLFIGEMAASPLIALVVLVIVVGARPAALPVAAPILALWFAAPVIAAWLSRPVQPPRQRLDEEDRLLLRVVARKTWRYFEAFMGADGSRAASRQLPGGPGPDGGASHLAHQHRDGTAVHPCRARPRLHRHRRAAGEARGAHDDHGGARAARGAPPQLVRHEHPGPADAPLRVHRRQRQPRGRAHRHGGWPAAPGDEPADRRR